LDTPTFDEVKGFDIENNFWNLGSLDHPSEPWAVDSKTKDGIQAYLEVTHCQDELHQIARETRQGMKWAIEKGKKINHMYEMLQNGWSDLSILSLHHTSNDD
jgi:hypothetical protein